MIFHCRGICSTRTIPLLSLFPISENTARAGQFTPDGTHVLRLHKETPPARKHSGGKRTACVAHWEEAKRREIIDALGAGIDYYELDPDRDLKTGEKNKEAKGILRKTRIFFGPLSLFRTPELEQWKTKAMKNNNGIVPAGILYDPRVAREIVAASANVESTINRIGIVGEGIAHGVKVFLDLKHVKDDAQISYKAICEQRWCFSSSTNPHLVQTVMDRFDEHEKQSAPASPRDAIPYPAIASGITDFRTFLQEVLGDLLWKQEQLEKQWKSVPR